MRIALDAMGGDRAPDEIVKGALLAVEANSDVEIILIGDEQAILSSLGDRDAPPERISIRHSDQVIESHEAPVSAIKKKPEASIPMAVKLVSAGEANAVVSAGNTGAMVASTSFFIDQLEGVRRPGIATLLPSVGGGECAVIDLGANIECKPVHLLQYAIMAGVFHKVLFGEKKPRVGLLNVGAEAAKGNRIVKEAYALLESSHLNFVGNVEGGDIFLGNCDVVVCDGFTGNILLKASEGIAEFMISEIDLRAEGDVWTRMGRKLMRPVIDELQRRVDFSEHGGALLLGVDGICIICHGRSDATAIKSAVGVAARFVREDVNGRITAELAAESGLWEKNSESAS